VRPPATLSSRRAALAVGSGDLVAIEIENLHNVVLVRVRSWHHAGRDGDLASIREALQTYADVVVGFINGDRT
jgi:hypothetical protein